MATVVIIHAAEDTLPARALAEKLRQAKLAVTLEHSLGEPLREAVRNAQVTVALWSPRAVAQPAIVDEVQAARGKSKVVHALMQSATLPEQFAGEQPINLTGWRGEDDFQPWRDLARLVTSKAGVANLPPPAPKPPSGFFQPGPVETEASAAPRPAARPQQAPRQQQAAPPRPQPAPRPQPQPAPRAPQPAPRPAPYASAPEEPRGGGGRGMMMGLIALVIVGLAGGGGYWFMTQNQGAQTTSLEDVDVGSAAALRDFLASNPSPAEREQAREALATLEQQSLDAARDANTIEAFEQFLRDFPESEEAVFVQGQIQQLRVLEAERAGEGPPETATGAPITELGPDPDLLPPGTMPDASGGPVPLTPPPTEPPQEPGTTP
jgi:hypothetical protein